MSDPSLERTQVPRMSAAADTWPLNAREAAARLGVHERTVRRAIARGEIAAAKRAGIFRIAPDELERYRALHGARRSGASVPVLATHQLIAFPGVARRHGASLPRPLSSLVGREQEIAAVMELIGRARERLVTLTGPGGVGKTRLAIAAADAVEGFDRVTFVSLATTRDPVLVGGAIAQALGIRGGSGRVLIDRLRPALHGTRTLLVLDNFEHLVDAAPHIADLLGAFPALAILVTSRVRLRLTGERIHGVPSLALATPGDDAFPAAARLFVERARAARPGLVVHPEDRAVIVEICRRLDGLPLAIELAAARATVLTPSGLLERLDRRLPMLTGGARDLPARQQTMRDTIAWSYELLPPAEQELFRRLSVFVGGLTLAAALHVGAQADMSDEGTLAALGALVDASLLRLGDDSRIPRYVMLETMREYGQELLERLEETRAARDVHASFFLGLDAWLDPNSIAPGVSVDDRLREIEPEEPNLEAALAHLAEVDDASGVLHLAGQCAIFWHHRSYLAEGRRWLEYALSHTPPEPTLDRGNALAGLSLILFTQVEPGLARPLAEEALAIGRGLGDDHLVALALHMQGIIATLERRWHDARAHMEAALARWMAVGEQSSTGMALVILGEIEYELGASSRSRARAEEALAILASIGHDSGMAFALAGLARIDLDQGNHAAALRTYQEALRLWAGIGERWGSVRALIGLAAIAASADQPDLAARLLGVIHQRIAQTGAGVFPVDHGPWQRATASARAALGEERFAQLLTEGQSLATAEVVTCAMAITAPTTRRAHADGLSRREREVLRLMVEGRSNAEIADALYIGVRTARSHVASILGKLNVPTRTAAATHAIRHNLV